MGRPAAFQPHKLFVAALLAPEPGVVAVRNLVESRFGPIDDELAPHPFTFSDYYHAEMGPSLERALFSIGPLVDPAGLAGFKEEANALESETAAGPASPSRPPSADARRVNLDPGLLSLSRVVLASTKASAHRVPLRDGLYAEITLLYRRGRYRPLEWTYPDYQSDRFVEWLARVRARYHEQLRSIDPDRAWRL
ncbi:MAG: DUF4416 family protein [Spirochaetota bacterium]